jgi:hypothetical protein
LWSCRPGANSLRLDPAGFTLRVKGRDERYEWRFVARMVIVGRFYGYRGVGSRAAGIEVTFRDGPFAPPVRIGDHYTIRRHALLSIMSGYAGPAAATTPPEKPIEDVKFERKSLISVVANMVVIGELMAVVGSIVEVRGGSPMKIAIGRGVIYGVMPIVVFAFYYFLNSERHGPR